MKEETNEKYSQSWKNKVKKSSENMFSLAEESIASYPGLKVIIVSRIPRFDSTVKSQLSQYGNSLNHNLWMEKGCPNNIRIHKLGLDCYGPLKEKRYGTPGTRGFDGKFVDGIHMRGILAVKHYTDSFVRMFGRNVIISQPGRSQGRSDYHNSCEQAVYQRRQGCSYIFFPNENLP